MTSLRSRGRPRKASKAQIVENAMALYWQDGLATRSLNELCRQLEVSKPGLYREFGGEDGLIADCLTLYGQISKNAFEAIISDNQPFNVQLTEFIDQIFTFHDQFPQGCLLMQASREQRVLGPASLDALQSAGADFFKMVHSWVRSAQERGDIASNVSADVTSFQILAQIHSIHSGLAGGLAKKLVRELTDLSLYAVLPSAQRLH